MHAAKYIPFISPQQRPPPLPPKDGGLLNWGGGGILQRSPENLLFTLGNVYRKDASGAEQMSETNNSNQT